MKFLRLDLRAFGPFADSPPIDLSGGSRGLHLIVGPNEAGKSSTLRAIRALLFGFPTRTADNQRHAYKDLRVGAILGNEQGEELAIIRRKGELRTLRTHDDNEIVAEEALGRYLGGLDQTRFDELFAMDHAELVAGGRGIIEGRGNLGSILFASGSGLARVDQVRQALDAEMEELFKPTGKNPSINAAIADLKAAREASELAMLATSEWVDLDATLARAIAKKAAIDAEIRRDDLEKRRLERLRDAWPVLDKLDGRIASRDAMGPVIVLPDGFADRRRDATSAHQTSTRAGQMAEAALEAIARDLEALGPRDPVLDEADAIGRIRDDLGLFRKTLEARPVEQARLARIEADARNLLAELRPGSFLDEAESLRVPATLRDRIGSLAEELLRIEANLGSSENQVIRLLEASPGIDRIHPPADALRLLQDLAETARQAQARGDLEAQVAAARADSIRLEREALGELKRLPLWSGTLEGLESLAVPSIATLDRFEAEFRSAEEIRSREATDLARLEADKATLDREIAREQGGRAVPTEESLVDRRALRDEQWRAIRRAWLETRSIEEPARVADEFEATVRTSDELADRLRFEADAVAEQAQRLYRRRELLDRIAAQAAALEASNNQKARLEQDWRGLWRSIGLDPLPPREMKDWVAIRRADLIRQAKLVRERKLEQEQTAADLGAIKADLARQLARLGEPPAESPETLPALLSRSKATADRWEQALRLETARGQLARAEADRAGWGSRWALAVGPLNLPGDASTRQALAVIDRFNVLADRIREVEGLRIELDRLAQVEARFESAIASLGDRLGIRSAGQGGTEAEAREIAARFDRARLNETRREAALDRREEEFARLDEARAGVDRAEASLSSLIAEAGCGSADGLIAAGRISDQFKAIQDEIRSLEGQLATLAGPIPTARLREQLDGLDPESLEIRIADLADRLEPLERDRDQLAEEIGRCRQKLDAMDGGPAAADAQQAIEERVARLALDVERYASLRLASAVLREAVERYRKEHQGPVLDRAGALFARLTAGSFAGLRADLDDKGEPVLMGVRADGATLLKVEGMSEGTADQLYLSLRIASLQTYMDEHDPIPLIVDDILVNFDNARGLAALEALAELSTRTQVLFFTHHDHLVDLARSTLGDRTLFVHRLEFPPVSLPPPAPDAADPARPKARRKREKLAAEE